MFRQRGHLFYGEFTPLVSPLVVVGNQIYYCEPVTSYGHYFPTGSGLTLAGARQAALHERAAGVTRERFGRAVFVRAVVEVSNFCRENCAYCGMRRDNRSLKRFRARHEQLAEMLRNIARPASPTSTSRLAKIRPPSVKSSCRSSRPCAAKRRSASASVSARLRRNCMPSCNPPGRASTSSSLKSATPRDMKNSRPPARSPSACDTSGCWPKTAGMSAPVSSPACRDRPWMICWKILKSPVRFP